MRVGSNPNKNIYIDRSSYIHQILIPVYIPNNEGYYKDSFKILKNCLTSIFKTVHNKTFITIVNNGSSTEVKFYLDELYNESKIHELINTENIGKLNAILKGLVGNNIELVTIADADVLFLPNWQKETIKVFKNVPKAGVVGITPQFKMYEAYCGNVIYDNLFDQKMKFIAVKDPESLIRFYDSIGWDKDYNQDYLKYNLGLEINEELTVLVGSAHFVGTYRKDVFNQVISFISYKMGGTSLKYLDKAPLKKGYWRLTTQNNYAYHMGNTYEKWMDAKFEPTNYQNFSFRMPQIHRKETNKLMYFIKNRLFTKFISIPFLNRLFLKWKGLPKSLVKTY